MVSNLLAKNGEVMRNQRSDAVFADPFGGDDESVNYNPLYVPRRNITIVLEIPADNITIVDAINGLSPEYQHRISNVIIRDRSLD